LLALKIQCYMCHQMASLAFRLHKFHFTVLFKSTCTVNPVISLIILIIRSLIIIAFISNNGKILMIISKTSS